MAKTLKIAGLVAIVLGALVVGGVVWFLGLDRDAGIVRPTFARFTLTGGAADGSAPPAPDGFRIDSVGDGRILPPLPPEKALDIHTAANAGSNLAIRSCFWPGPRARSGVFTNDGASFSFENQFPDTATTYIPTAFILPEGARLTLRGAFAHMRHWNLNTYNDKGEPQDALNDVDIEPDPGSVNPFKDGVPRNASARKYTISIVSGARPAKRAPNTLYTNAQAGAQVYLWMRNYVPDNSKDYLGGVPLPTVEVTLADGQVLSGEEACKATAAPMRGRQLPRTVPPKLWLALSHLPWIDRANVGASKADVVPLQAFFNRQQVLSTVFFPMFAKSDPEQRGGWWSNRATRYGYVYLSRRFGKVYVLTGRMPQTPTTWHGELDKRNAETDMRYMSICTGGAPPSGVTTDCAYDEQLLPTRDAEGRFYVVLSRAEDRPANATAACGVVWLDIGNGDGLVGGSPEFASILNRHTIVNPTFQHSWFAVARPGDERKAMGEYLPYLVNMHDKASFEALGCQVAKNRIAARLPRAD
jgi:hypothetical protein